MIFLPVLYVFAVGSNPGSYLENECYDDGRCQSSRACHSGRCLAREEKEDAEEEELLLETKQRTSVSGMALFVAGLVLSGLFLTAEAAGWFPYVGVGLYIFELGWIGMVMGSAYSAVDQLKSLGIIPGKKLKPLLAAFWTLWGMAAGALFPCIFFSFAGSTEYVYAWDDPEASQYKNVYVNYLIVLYGVAIPLAIAALAIAISTRIVAARKVKSVLTTGYENDNPKSNFTFSPHIFPSATGFTAGLDGTF